MQVLDPLKEQARNSDEPRKLNTETKEQCGNCLGRGYIPGARAGVFLVPGVGGSIPGLVRVMSTTWVCVLS